MRNVKITFLVAQTAPDVLQLILCMDLWYVYDVYDMFDVREN